MKIHNLRFEFLVSAGCLVLLAYFAWHAWYGARSHTHVRELEANLANLQSVETRLVGQKIHRLAQVNLMRPESVDPDMLEELARSKLGWAGANELIVKTSQ
jgi:cell division protein FtsB